MLTEEQILKTFNAMKSDKGKAHGYHVYYKDILNPIPKSLLEIGVETGSSLAAWRGLMPAIDLYGLDITRKKFDKEYIRYAGAKIIEGDSTIQRVTSNFPSVDVIIDDGSHFYKDQIKTFEVFHGKCKKVYVIEDVLYNLDLVVDSIKAKGYSNIEVLPSKTRQVSVDLNFLENNSREKTGNTVLIDLFMIVVKK